MTSLSTLPGSCARSASAVGARQRIDAQVSPSRGVRVIALDAGAAQAAWQCAALPWSTARFFACADAAPAALHGAAEQLALRAADGATAVLADQVAEADVVVMVATEDGGAACASAIGRVCADRGIMTAGLVLGGGPGAGLAVAALRPHARVLLTTAQHSDLTELLTALRA